MAGAASCSQDFVLRAFPMPVAVRVKAFLHFLSECVP